MAKAKGTIELEVKSDRFNSGVDKILSGINSIKAKTGELKQSFTGLTQPANQAAKALTDICLLYTSPSPRDS